MVRMPGVAYLSLALRPTYIRAGRASSRLVSTPPDTASALLSFMIRRLIDRYRGLSRGQATIELALLLPVVLMLLLAAGDLARVFNVQVTIAAAARAGALEAAAHPTSFQAGQPCSALVNRVMCAVLTEANGSFATVDHCRRLADVQSGPLLRGPRQHGDRHGAWPHELDHPDHRGGRQRPDDVHRDIDGPDRGSANDRREPPPARHPTPTPSPTPTPTAVPDSGANCRPVGRATPTPSPTPTPAPTPVCFPPSADFSISPTSGKKKKTDFQFTDLSTTTPLCPLTWSWNFGDGGGASSTSTLQNPTHIYQAQGTYTVTLVASSIGGADTRTRTVTVTP